MADTKNFVTSAELVNSSRKYQKELIKIPVIAAKEDTLKHMTGIGDLLGDMVFSGMDPDVEFAPYSNTNWKEGDVKIDSRVLTTYMGNCAFNFDPNQLYATIYYDAQTGGKNLTHAEIVKKVMFLMAAKAGEVLNMHIWDAKRNPEGKATKDLFNGLDTITAAEVEATNISTVKGNMIELSEFDNSNAVDQLNAIYRKADPHLRRMKTKMYMSQDIYDLYVECYQNTRGQIVYNPGYEKATLEVGRGLVELCPMVSKTGSSFVHLAPKSVMLYGYHGNHPMEQFEAGDYHPWKTTIKACTVFGTQLLTLDKRYLMVGKIGSPEAA